MQRVSENDLTLATQRTDHDFDRPACRVVISNDPKEGHMGFDTIVIRLAVTAVAVALSVSTAAQQTSSPPESSLAVAFEVASIKLRTTAASGRFQSSPDRYIRPNSSVRDLIRDAYQLQSYQILGVPVEMGMAVRFDVNAKAPFVPSPEQMREMLRRLLAERFALRVHRETREMQTYLLQLARADGRLGKQITRTTVDCAAIKAQRNQMSEAATPAPTLPNGQLACASSNLARPSQRGLTLRYQGSGVTTRELAESVSQYVGLTVIDGTGLTGEFDFEISFRPGDPIAPAEPGDPVPIFEALQEQLGLKLVSSRGPVEVLVIDHVEHPTPD
jgi:uncharacterized protein (TIGR03435 family)